MGTFIKVNSEWNGYQVMATPATCIQFKPDCQYFSLDTLQPGWREIELHSDGSIRTQIETYSASGIFCRICKKKGIKFCGRFKNRFYSAYF